MGGRGGASGIGRYQGGPGLDSGDILSTRSLVSEREEKPALVDQVLGVFKDVNDDYNYIIGDIQIATLNAKGSGVLAYYSRDDTSIAVNDKFFSDAMENAYQRCVQNGFHPGSGNKTGMEATIAHELGHALTGAAAVKMGLNNVTGFDQAASRIVNEARAQTNHRGVVQMAAKISVYATESNSEAIAEAYSDVYCNGDKAHAESKAIISVLNKYAK